MSRGKVNLEKLLTRDFKRELQDVSRPRGGNRDFYIKAVREGRKPVTDWFPEPEPVKFNVSVQLQGDGDVQLSWVAGTDKRGNHWRVALSFAAIEDLYRKCSEINAVYRERALKNASLEALLWCELFKNALPADFDRIEGEVRAFISRPTMRAKRNRAKVRRRQ